MREIKFRVYEPINKKMHYLDFALYNYSKGTNSHKFVLPLDKQGLQNPYTMMNLDAVEVMQYTGLNDKNGREIYEGDIVQFKFDGEYKKSIVCMDVIQGTTCSFNSYNLPYTFNLDKLLCSDREFKVIGNIYENPELIEGE